MSGTPSGRYFSAALSEYLSMENPDMEACPDCSGKGGDPYTGICASCLGLGELPRGQ